MTWLLPILFAPFIGSFIGTLAMRLPAATALVLDRSRCDHCGHTLGPLDLVPMLSWAAARGRCRHCQAAVSVFHPAIELAALGVAVWAALTVPEDELWLSCVLGWGLLALAVIDYRDYLLPDAITLPLVALGLGAAYLDDPTSVLAHGIGAVAGFLVFLVIALAYRRLRGREGLGFGDAKLLAAAGAWVGWQGLPSVVLLGATASFALLLLLGLRGMAVRFDARLPFGPGLCLGLWLVWLYGPLG
jgi:leader peptidase (prepilin peptidase) / N-methyltransferase